MSKTTYAASMSEGRAWASGGVESERGGAKTDEVHEERCAEKFAESEFHGGEASDALVVEGVLLCFPSKLS